MAGSAITISIINILFEVVIGDLIGPETEVESSWKRAYVYGFDKIEDPTSDRHWLVFYNGRLDTTAQTTQRPTPLL